MPFSGSRPEYLIRFDDICPTISWDLWNAVEQVVNFYDVKPILAVIPDNQDPSLVSGPPALDFWQRVRKWQAQGWTIGIHGYRHQYTTAFRGLVGVNRYSEFAGLPFEEQYRKLEAGLAIFKRENVTADLWVAPAHTFDTNTLRALSRLGISTVSDGHSPRPYVDSHGILWIPQQLGQFRKIPFGVWTVCIHATDKLYLDLRHLREQLEKFRKHIVSVASIRSRYAYCESSFLSQNVGRVARWTKLFKQAINT